MPSHAGPNTAGESNLVFAIDTHDTSNGITPLGCGGFEGSTQGVKNILNNNVYQFVNGLRLSGRTYYTAAGISYPEWTYGGDIAGANGLYLGYNVRGGTNVYGASRSLHLWVWNNQTNSWVSGYFNGARLNGHCYDNYAGAENGWESEMTKFVNDFNTVKNTFPDCTYIILGSHACQSFRQQDIDILISLGAPSGTVSSWTDNSAWREFVLVGKPGLGSGNAFGWAYQNYPTDTSAVAHLNFGLPIKARGSLEFDGTNDYINCGDIADLGTNDFTVSVWVYIPSGTPSNFKAIVNKKGASAADAGYGIYYHTGYKQFLWSTANGSSASEIWTTNSFASIEDKWAHIVMVRQNGATNNGCYYVNGIYQSLASSATVLNVDNSYELSLGVAGNNYTTYCFQGNISKVEIYNRALTPAEVKQNYNKYKSRFNLS